MRTIITASLNNRPLEENVFKAQACLITFQGNLINNVQQIAVFIGYPKMRHNSGV
ncbi:hypothetical protein [Psychrobacter glacincola]|uniref:hypothetical protein n=1 Tax=Psychrobacter glacincola TaxID=56810 RepID=UPI0039AEC342